MCSFVVFSSDKLPLSDFDKALKYGIVKPELTEEERLAKALEDMEKEVVYLGALTVYQ